MPAKLPAQFADLEPFVDGWALPTETQRYAKRLSTPYPEIQAFYDAILPLGTEALDYLDQYSMDSLPDDALESPAAHVLAGVHLDCSRGVGPGTHPRHRSVRHSVPRRTHPLIDGPAIRRERRR